MDGYQENNLHTATVPTEDCMTELTLQTPECFQPLAQPSRYKAAFGGRGSGKSWHFASMVVEHCLTNPGSKHVCIREVNALRPMRLAFDGDRPLR